MTSSSSSYRKKVYTKFGDKGETSLLYGGRVSKNNPHTEAYGITDEAVSAMGLGRAKSDDPRVKDILRDLQRDLFMVAAELATDPDKYELFKEHFTPVTEDMVESLESTIDSLEEEFQMPTVFVLPGGSEASAAIDMGRTIIRTAERRVVALEEAGRLANGLITAYLNRLGDLLFVLARYQDRHLPIERATGERATGERATGERATGERATGERATGERATGERATGERATGERATGERATGERT